MSGVGSRETGLDRPFRLETGWSRVRALPRPISQVGWSAETTLSVCPIALAGNTAYFLQSLPSNPQVVLSLVDSFTDTFHGRLRCQ